MIAHALRHYFAARRDHRHDLADRYTTGGVHALASAARHLDDAGQHTAAVYLRACAERLANEGRWGE